MSEFKGTSGIWTVCGNIPTLVRNDNARSICTTGNWTDSTNVEGTDMENEANAKLIQASKDLLEFAIDFVNKVETGRARSTDSYNKAKAAIKKALGE